MTKVFLLTMIAGVALDANAQQISSSKVPSASKAPLAKTYPQAKKVTWEKENGNFEGNWKSAENNHAVTLTPYGKFAGPESDIDHARLYVSKNYLRKSVKYLSTVMPMATKHTKTT